MNHEEYFALMMDTLDGEVSELQQNDLQAHLRACPECNREWQALLAIDTLFRMTPALSPAAGFVERTIALLPDRRVRIWAMGAIYGLLLLGGLIPVVLVGLLVGELLPVLRQPAVVESVAKSLQSTYQTAGAVMGALVSGAGEAAVQQPALIGLLLVMMGIIFLWGGVYRQLNLVRV
jgi:anti-sigma factor RsiW